LPGPSGARVHFDVLVHAADQSAVAVSGCDAEAQHGSGALFTPEIRDVFRRLKRFPDRRRVGDDRDVLPLASNARLTDRREMISRRHLFLDATVEILVLEVENAVLVANR